MSLERVELVDWDKDKNTKAIELTLELPGYEYNYEENYCFTRGDVLKIKAVIDAFLALPRKQQAEDI